MLGKLMDRRILGLAILPILLILVVSFSGCILLPTPTAYVYSTDIEAANSYKSLLDANGFPTTLVPMSAVATTDFSVYSLIIVGSDTGYKDSWGDPASVAAIDNSMKPIIGLGKGGYAFFGKLMLNTGWPHGVSGSENSIYVVDTTHAVFSTPYPILIPPNRVIQLYTATEHVGIYLPSIPPNVVTLGRQVVDPNYYPLTLENSRYLFWGFTASPASMLDVGRNLFINVADYLAPI